MNAELIKPSMELETPFKKLVWEYIESKDVHYTNNYVDALEDYTAYVARLERYSNGQEVMEGWVPFTTYWLVDKTQEEPLVIGNLRIRHVRVESAGHIGYDIRPSCRRKGYGAYILKLGLEKAKSIGISDVYLTVDHDNESSIRIIEAAGGIYTRTFDEPEENVTRREYVIHV